MFRRRQLLVMGVAATALCTALLPVTAAQAYTSQSFVTPTTITEQVSGEGSIRATLRLSGMAAGEVHNLRAEAVIGNPQVNGAPGRVAAGGKITCQPVGGATIANAQVWGGRNLLSTDGDVTYTWRLLFVAPSAGDYDCHLRVYLNKDLNGPAGNYTNETASLKSGFIGDIDGALTPAYTAQALSNATANDFLGLGATGKQINPVNGYTPPPGATSFKAVGDLTVTSCYQDDNHCPAGTYPSTGGEAKVYSRVVATPSSTASGCVVQASTPTTVTVSRAVHHMRILHTLTVTAPSGGCGTWRINIFTKDDGGTLPFVANTAGPYTVTYARP